LSVLLRTDAFGGSTTVFQRAGAIAAAASASGWGAEPSTSVGGQPEMKVPFVSILQFHPGMYPRVFP
jgi:hypothetical protein